MSFAYSSTIVCSVINRDMHQLGKCHLVHGSWHPGFGNHKVAQTFSSKLTSLVHEICDITVSGSFPWMFFYTSSKFCLLPLALKFDKHLDWAETVWLELHFSSLWMTICLQCSYSGDFDEMFIVATWIGMVWMRGSWVELRHGFLIFCN